MGKEAIGCPRPVRLTTASLDKPKRFHQLLLFVV